MRLERLANRSHWWRYILCSQQGRREEGNTKGEADCRVSSLRTRIGADCIVQYQFYVCFHGVKFEAEIHYNPKYAFIRTS